MSGSSGTVDVAMLAKLFNLTARRVQQLAQEGVIPRADHGKYPLIPAIQGYIKFLQDRLAGSADAMDLSTQRARLAREQAVKVERENALARGELAPVSLIEQVLAAAGARVGGVLDGIPGAIRRRTSMLTPEALRCIEEEVALARRIAARVSIQDVLDAAVSDDE